MDKQLFCPMSISFRCVTAEEVNHEGVLQAGINLYSDFMTGMHFSLGFLFSIL